jgi:hypothetical protein
VTQFSELTEETSTVGSGVSVGGGGVGLGGSGVSAGGTGVGLGGTGVSVGGIGVGLGGTGVSVGSSVSAGWGRVVVGSTATSTAVGRGGVVVGPLQTVSAKVTTPRMASQTKVLTMVALM